VPVTEGAGVVGGVWAAPGRVNLIGEHTDYNDGFVLPFALPRRTVVRAAAASVVDGWTVTSRGETVSFSAADLVPGRVQGWAGYVAGVVWALRSGGYDVPGASLDVTSDVPVGAGLSSSAALECAVLAALADLGGLPLGEMERARLARRAENDYVGVPCGIMDQAASTSCREGHALFLDCRTEAVSHVPLPLAETALAVLVVDSRAPHRLADGEYASRLAACAEAARVLGVPALRDATPDDLARLDDPVLRRRARHVVTENARVLATVALLERGDLRGIGRLLTASHASMRDDYEITVPEVDTAVEAALAAGAYGARMTGGGFGGCVIALVDADSTQAVAAAVETAYAAKGFRAPEWFVAVPAAGAQRLS
jgi:galactokinase